MRNRYESSEEGNKIHKPRSSTDQRASSRQKLRDFRKIDLSNLEEEDFDLEDDEDHRR